MRAEYLLFNVFVALGPLILSVFPLTFFLHRWGKALTAATVVSLPYLVWDALVTGRHWDFNPEFILGFKLFGLPFEEILFFFTVPCACIYTWEMLVKADRDHARPALLPLYVPMVALVPTGGWVFTSGKEYTGLMLAAIGLSAVLDLALRTRLLQRPKTWLYLVAVVVLTLIFNNYLTGRPVVLYGEQYQLGWRIFTMPIEDAGYGVALNFAVVVVYEFLKKRQQSSGDPGWLAKLIERRFGGYKHQFADIDTSKPENPEGTRRVLVVGSGLAGLATAARLSQRGYAVTMREKNDYLGGKVGAWRSKLPSGRDIGVEHGFHAFFPHYYNLLSLLDTFGVRQNLRTIKDYLIMDRDGTEIGFKGVSNTPIVNLVSLAAHGVYDLREVAGRHTGTAMECFLRYDGDKTFEKFDHENFDDFAARARLPKSLRLVFSNFARAFFAEGDRLSMAELIKSFHFFYLSNDGGLLYDFFDDDYTPAFLNPAQAHLEAQGVTIELESPVGEIEALDEHFRVDGESYDAVVLATDVVGTKAILGGSPALLEAHPQLQGVVDNMRAGQRYSVLKLYLDRDVKRTELPVFVTTERVRLLDSVTAYHRVTKECATLVREDPEIGGVFELHSYAVPDDLGSNEEIRDQFLEELHVYFPELADAKVVHEEMQVRRDMTAFHTGMYATRPGVDVGVPGLYLASDYLKLPRPAMLMEAATMAGFLAANAVFERDGVRQSEVWSVPEKGFLVRR